MSSYLHPVVARLMLDSHQYTTGLTKANAKMEETAAKSEGSAGRWGKAINGANAMILGAIGVGVGESMKMAGDFQQKMMLIRTQAHDTTDSITEMGKQVIELAPQVSQSPEALAEALFHVTSVGYRGAQALAILKQGALGATVSGANLDDTMYSLSSMMNTLNAKASDAGTVMAQLNAIVGAGDMRFQDLNRAIGTGYFATAKTFGVSVQAAGAALAFMTDRGAKADEAATRLRMTMALLAAPSDKAAKMLSAIGLKGPEVHAATKTMTEALKKAHLTTVQLSTDLEKPNGLYVALNHLHTALVKSGLSASQANALLSKSFGGGKSDATILAMLNSLDTLKGKYYAVGDGTKRFSSDVKDTKTTFNAQMKSMEAAAQGMGIQLGNALMPIMTKLLNVLAPIFSLYGPGLVKAALGAFALKKGFDGIMLSARGVNKAMDFFKAGGSFDTIRLRAMYATDGVKKFGGILRDAGSSGLTSFRIRAMYATDAMKSFGGKVMDASTTVLNKVGSIANSAADMSMKWGKAIGGMIRDGAKWAGAQVIKAATIIATNVGIAASATATFIAENAATLGIIAGIVALVAAVVWVATHWHQTWSFIKRIAMDVWHWIINTLHNKFVQAILAPIAPLLILALHWHTVWNGIKRVADLVWRGIKAVIEDIVKGFMDVVHFFVSMDQKIWNVVKGAGSWLFNVGKDIIKGLINGIKNMALAPLKAIADVGSSIVSHVKSLFGINSPSRVFADIGSGLNEGMAKGITNSQSLVMQAQEMQSQRLLDSQLRQVKRHAGLVAKAQASAAVAYSSTYGSGTHHVVHHTGHRSTLEAELKQAFLEALNESTFHADLYVDGKKLQTALIGPAQRYKKSNGGTGLT